jgi:hypothetical protein
MNKRSEQECQWPLCKPLQADEFGPKGRELVNWKRYGTQGDKDNGWWSLCQIQVIGWGCKGLMPVFNGKS